MNIFLLDYIRLVKEKDISYHITTSENQYTVFYNDISTILFGECENILREHYKISHDIPLLILKIEKYDERLLIPIIEYEIYNYETREKLNLNYCSKTKINILIPVKIDETILFKYNSSSEYYNDPCNKYKTEFGTDIILKDRRNEYQENYMALCEANCELVEYNYTTKKVNCECEVKNTFTLFSDITIDKDRLLNKFTDIKASANIIIIVCYKLLFTEEGLKNNIGSYTIVSIIFINIISLLYFSLKGFKIFHNMINKIISNNKKKEIITKKKINNHLKKTNAKKNKNQKNKSKFKRTHPKNPIKNKENKIFKKKKINKYRKISVLLTNNNIINISHNKSNSKNTLRNSKKNLFIRDITDILNKKRIINNGKSFLQLNDFELNSLTYNEALKIDKRNYLQYYFSLLRTKHLLIFTFYTRNDFNSMIIKICLFFFSFGLYLTITALFFSDSTITKIYEDEGIFNFIYQIKKILYSTMISSAINIFIKFLSLSENNIIELKKEKKNLEIKSKNILKCLKIKFFFFFLFSFLFLFIFWYYISIFCSVYKNTQIYLIKDVLISFGITLLYPFILNLLPGIFIIISLKTREKDLEYLYKISKIIEKI